MKNERCASCGCKLHKFTSKHYLGYGTVCGKVRCRDNGAAYEHYLFRLAGKP